MFLPSEQIIEFFPEYRSTQIAWQGLTPIAAWAIIDLKPRRVVELGSYRGDSFFSFLQAAQSVSELEDLVAVDTWEGDQHTGAYVEDVHKQFHDELASRNDPRARSIRDYFVNAAQQFDANTIDLLHIDGAHDYASVREDFETWLPKMAADGVVLFHDTMVRTDGFGVWQFWEELEQEYPGRCFNFTHSNGLGVLCLGTSTTGEIRKLCDLDPVDAGVLRDVMTLAGEQVTKSTTFEAKLITRNGGKIGNEHVFARGAQRVALEAARGIEAQFGLDQVEVHMDQRIDQKMNYRVEQLVHDQTDDLFAALKPQLDEHARIVADARFELLRKEHIGVAATLKKVLKGNKG
ncbi:class I SAM-dependent methyltransferase [Aliiroseovarius sediminis]|uniref:class I SAM-dependent methyltransferase n=1 Tax=Aliiroseovarius sediminis TaxID=2925839 RepID=UPI001F57D07C|nr:class I SAM-dependent methyltransferase [Aliiroseovarius sediminis]MCI2395751.1 class I SAM-dependent methyltransferase [Aliiroseovarius sediminis]